MEKIIDNITFERREPPELDKETWTRLKSLTLDLGYSRMNVYLKIRNSCGDRQSLGELLADSLCKGSHIVLAKNQGYVIGWALMKRKTSYERNFSLDVYVDKAWRGRGIGRDLVGHARIFLGKDGRFVNDDNSKDALLFWEKIGRGKIECEPNKFYSPSPYSPTGGTWLLYKDGSKWFRNVPNFLYPYESGGYLVGRIR